ncbi:MAG: OmpA family protein [Hyphomicrobium sp.]|nr:OmpA family protein [Hyphomicrobium sp.]
MRRSAFDILLGLLLAIASATVLLQAAALVRGDVSADIVHTFVVVATFAIPLALLVIWLGEIRRVRGLAFWLAAGGLIAGISFATAYSLGESTLHALAAVIASGIVGGLTYWPVAGRRAGAFASAVDRDNQAAEADGLRARRNCWACVASMLTVGLVPLALIGWHFAEPSQVTWPDSLQRQAEEHGDRLITEAGLPWAALKIENHVGRIIGTAPSPLARSEAFAKAEAALKGIVGLPGVVAYLQNDIKVAETAETPLVIMDDRVLQASQAVTETRARRMRLVRGMRNAKMRRVTKAQAERKLMEERAAAAERRAADAALDAKRRADAAAAEASRKAEEARRLALEAERERNAVAAARKEEAEKADAGNAELAKSQAPAPAPTNCDAEFAQLFKSTTLQFDRNVSAFAVNLGSFFDQAASLAKQCTDYTIDIAGHADRTGRKSSNLATSLARASAVRDALQARGVPLSRLKATGYGDSRPLDPSRNRAAFARNRRVELSATRTLASAPQAQDVARSSVASKPMAVRACHVRLSRVAAAAGIRFAVNATRIGPAARRAIADVARVMRRCPNHALAINGHADRRGTIEDNRRLSESRANAVRDDLIRRGVDVDRLSAIGHGALMPAAKAETRSAYAKNRRVDFDVSAMSPRR